MAKTPRSKPSVKIQRIINKGSKTIPTPKPKKTKTQNV